MRRVQQAGLWNSEITTFACRPCPDEGKSDGSIVPTTTANNGAAEALTESDEGRDPAKRNAAQAALLRTPSRTKRKSRGLHGLREAARKGSTLKFTALLHHVNEDCLREAFYDLKKTAAVGVDGVTWQEYERNVEANIANLHDRIQRGAYRAQPSRRVWIPKPDGRQRPLGIASLEDKIVQQAVLWVLAAHLRAGFPRFQLRLSAWLSANTTLRDRTTSTTRRGPAGNL